MRHEHEKMREVTCCTALLADSVQCMRIVPPDGGDDPYAGTIGTILMQGGRRRAVQAEKVEATLHPLRE